MELITAIKLDSCWKDSMNPLLMPYWYVYIYNIYITIKIKSKMISHSQNNEDKKTVLRKEKNTDYGTVHFPFFCFFLHYTITYMYMIIYMYLHSCQ